MADNSRVRNLAVLLVLVMLFAIPAIFVPSSIMLDIVSFFMLVFGIAGMYLIAQEVWTSFWSGLRDRASLALYGLFSLFFSVVMMRTYGILTRNSDAAEAILAPTHAYGVMVYVSFIGLWLFSRASTPPTVADKGGKYGQLVVGIILGALIASSKLLEPILAGVSKFFPRIF